MHLSRNKTKINRNEEEVIELYDLDNRLPASKQSIESKVIYYKLNKPNRLGFKYFNRFNATELVEQYHLDTLY